MLATIAHVLSRWHHVVRQERYATKLYLKSQGQHDKAVHSDSVSDIFRRPSNMSDRLTMDAQALVSSLGWTYLDVRPSIEVEDVGKVKNSVNVPIMNATKKWDSEQQKKVVKKEDNPNFVAQASQNDVAGDVWHLLRHSAHHRDQNL